MKMHSNWHEHCEDVNLRDAEANLECKLECKLAEDNLECKQKLCVQLKILSSSLAKKHFVLWLACTKK